MIYDKPRVVMLSAATKLIQGVGCKLCDIYLDKCITSLYYLTYTTTISAFEADE